MPRHIPCDDPHETPGPRNDGRSARPSLACARAAVEPLEPRVLLSADPLCVAGDLIGGATSPPVSCGLLPGDANGDQVVDAVDLGVLAGDWGAIGRTRVDWSGDGVVDVTDLAILAANWTAAATGDGLDAKGATQPRPASEVVEIPDDVLESILRSALHKPSGDLTDTDLASLITLSASRRYQTTKIEDLTGLEYCVNLQEADFSYNSIADVSALSGLGVLSVLDLDHNPLSDLSPLAEAPALEELSLASTQVIDLGPLSGVSTLDELQISDNQIADLSPLAGLTGLGYLYAGDNRIADLSPLSGLTHLKTVLLRGNLVRDLTPLVDNTGFGSGDRLSLQENPLGVSAYQTDLPTLQSRGLTYLAFDKAGSIAGTVFDDLGADGSLDEGDPPLSDVVVYLDADDNGLRDWTDLDDDGQWDQDEGERWTLTDAQGKYVFDSLYPTTGSLDDHHVRQIVPDGYSALSPADGVAYDVDLAPASNVTGKNFADVGEAVEAEVVDRHVFYNGTVLDGGNADANEDDDNAIDGAIDFFLPGQSSSSGQTVTGYAGGITGVMIDVAGLAGTPDAGSFEVRVGDSGDPASWQNGPAPAQVAVRADQGVDGSDRVTLLWDDDQIGGTWMQLTILSDANGGSLGLAENDVSYLGNFSADASGDGAVDVTDLAILAANWNSTTGGSADFTKDNNVDVTDLAILAASWNASLPPFTAP